jgi:hypothetical protein
MNAFVAERPKVLGFMVTGNPRFALQPVMTIRHAARS